jgi:hypothetical protein
LRMHQDEMLRKLTKLQLPCDSGTDE